ncbi:unnamed protein product [Cuscuta campestris]|uniref:CCHC-type domain-containing protein n=1 Tax=Cuscuta campestris TaxID=132261 RepID=A0A484L9Q8_9ASTE|nr:unnamed protein product [Cuscuta campestris]
MFGGFVFTLQVWAFEKFPSLRESGHCQIVKGREDWIPRCLRWEIYAKISGQFLQEAIFENPEFEVSKIVPSERELNDPSLALSASEYIGRGIHDTVQHIESSEKGATLARNRNVGSAKKRKLSTTGNAQNKPKEKRKRISHCMKGEFLPKRKSKRKKESQSQIITILNDMKKMQESQGKVVNMVLEQLERQKGDDTEERAFPVVERFLFLALPTFRFLARVALFSELSICCTVSSIPLPMYSLAERQTGKPEKLSEEEWEDLKDMATSTIFLCLANNTLRGVLGLTDPVDIWEKLESRYKSKSLTSRLYLKKRLFGLQMAEEANFNRHLDEFNKITTELESIDVKIEEEDKAMLLLASLPSSFDNIVTTLLFGKETLKFDEAVAALLMNETRRGGNRVSNDGQALVAKGAGRERGQSKERGGASQRFKSSSKSFRCYYCDEEGHFKRDCPKRRKEKKDGKTPVTAVAESSNQESEEDLFLATTKSLGVGTVQVRMFDGVVRTLTGVKHVPGLKGNLISLGALDSEGCRIFAQGGVLKISRGAMVVAKGVLSKGLYKLVEKDLTRKLSEGRITSATSGAFAWKKRVTFEASQIGGYCDLAEMSEVEPDHGLIN